ncbi:ferredoxin:thioredoxin reductase [Candidatus Woesearchaeota archaeon]|nr:ferredoxin:thioredoxin reductase [Candidatus Woesearchaeota archaeon]
MAEEKSVKKESKSDLKAAKQTLKSIRRYARASGYIIQPSTKILAVIIKGLLHNIKKHGYRYCPCRKPTGNPVEDKKIICPCIYHKDEIKNDGYCKCLLYYRKIK